MPSFFKINTALVLSMVFVFRILFVNAGIISSVNGPKSNSAIKSHFSTVMKRSKHSEVVSSSVKNADSSPEICEEYPNGTKQLKSTPFFFIQILFCQNTNKLKYNLQKTSSGRYIACISSNRHLKFRTFRI